MKNKQSSLNIQSVQRGTRLLLCMSAMLLFPILTMAQLRTDIAACEELKPPDLQEQVKLCTAHPGCNLIMGSHKTCIAAKGFFEKLKVAVGEGTKSLFGYRKEVTSNHVFDASLSDVAKKMEVLPEARDVLEGRSWRMSKVDRDKLIAQYGVHAKGLLAQIDAADQNVLELKSRTGNKIIFIGNTHDVRAMGYGTMFLESGQISRGDFQYPNNSITGYGDIWTPGKGVRRIGYFDEDAPHKDFEQTVIVADGTVFQGVMDANVNLSGKGKIIWPNGKVKLEGMFENDLLSIGKSYDENGVLIALVNKPAEALKRAEDKRIADAAKKALEAQQLAEVKAAEEKKQAEAKAAEEKQQAAAKAADQKQFQQTLTKLNAGELFVLADKLSNEGDNDKAREARRTLVSRFPNNSLAVMAAQQMAANSSGTTANANSSSKSSTTPSPGKAAKFASVCERNFKKLDDAMYKRKIASSSALYDLFMRDFNLDGAKIFEPCIGTSAEAATQYKRAMNEYNRINQYCAGPHDAGLECTQWGPSGGVSDNGGHPFNNPAWYAGWKADVNKALSDPNYSAELGSAAGAVTTVINEAERVCEANLKVVENKFNAAQSNIPKNSVVVLSEATMWKITESIRVIESSCPNSERYRSQTAQFRQLLAQTKLVCDKSTSRTACVARLPEREPVAAPPPAPPPLKPLENKPPAVCEGGSGANFMKCEQEACGRISGVFSTKGSCAACTSDAGNWTHCAKGSGGVSSGQ